MLAFVLGAVILAAGLAAWGWSAGVLRFNHPSAQRFPVRGIDVSSYQGSVDWQRVRAQGYTFAYVKASEGGDFTDAAYQKLTAGARAAGLRVGAYHYFTFCRSGAEQARHAVDVISPVTRPGDLPLVVDLEFGGNCSHTPTPAELDREFGAFEAIVRETFGQVPVLYVTQDVRRRYVQTSAASGGALAGHRLWVRSMIGGPGGACESWAFWQFADRGRVDGVRGPVDLDTYCGDQAALDREFGPAPAASA